MSDFFADISRTKEIFIKYLKESCSSEFHLQLTFKYLVKLCFKVIFKRHKWVELFMPIAGKISSLFCWYLYLTKTISRKYFKESCSSEFCVQLLQIYSESMLHLFSKVWQVQTTLVKISRHEWVNPFMPKEEPLWSYVWKKNILENVKLWKYYSQSTSQSFWSSLKL